MSRTARKPSRPQSKAAAPASAVQATKHAPAAPSPSAGDSWVALARDPLDLALQSTTAWLHAAEALHKVQWDMTHLAVKRYQEMQQRLSQASELADVMAIQVELMRFDSAAAIKTGQELYDAAVASATEALNRARDSIDASRYDGVAPWLQTMQSMLHTGVRPLDDLFGHALLRDLMSRSPLAAAQPGIA